MGDDDNPRPPPLRLPVVPIYVWRYGGAVIPKMANVLADRDAASSSTPFVDLSTQVVAEPISHVRFLDLHTHPISERSPIDPQSQPPQVIIDDSPPCKSIADRIAYRYSGKRRGGIIAFPMSTEPTPTVGKAVRRVCLERPRRAPAGHAQRKRSKRTIRMAIDKKRKARNAATERRRVEGATFFEGECCSGTRSRTEDFIR